MSQHIIGLKVFGNNFSKNYEVPLISYLTNKKRKNGRIMPIVAESKRKELWCDTMENLNYYKKYFKELTNDNYRRFGKPFRTHDNAYFYDTGTGKVMQCNENVYKILSYLFGGGVTEYIENCGVSGNELLAALSEIKDAVEKENILKAPEVKSFHGRHVDSLEEAINEEVGQITLELTERCNLRCGYCIYGEGNDVFRNFGNEDMTFEIAKKAIDYGVNHSGDELAVTFYGGEPLLRFDLLKQCIDYCSRIKNKKFAFSMTTNLVLMDKEKAKYIADIPNFTVACSLDGPKDIQNQHRKFPNGKGSFDVVMQGLKNITEALGDEAERRLSFSMVMTPPYTSNKFDDIQEFFDSIPWLPKNTLKNVTYVQYGKIKNEDEKEYQIHPAEAIDPMGVWTENHVKDAKTLERGEIFTAKKMEDSLVRIHLRRLHHEPMDTFTFNGCCIPGSRRIYVTVQGKFKICERIGLSPYIGDVDHGVDIDAVKKHYIQDYMRESIKYCNECWAIHLCGICYTECYNENGIEIENKHALCNSQRYNMERGLIKYHEILEHNPESLEYINQMEIK